MSTVTSRITGSEPRHPWGAQVRGILRIPHGPCGHTALGEVTLSDQKFTVRWATQEPTKNGRTIVVVTDKPVFFAGGGAVNAKPREGYEVAVIRFYIDDAQLGTGEMAAAARVKPGGTTGVVIDDYAEKPIKLITVVKAHQ